MLRHWTCDCGNRRSLKKDEECPECGRISQEQNLAISREEIESLPYIIEVSEDSKICGQCTQITNEENCPNCGHLIEKGETLPYNPKDIYFILANG